MDTAGSGNAMTEIALALAMGFFSIMVLTMVSMGAGSGKTAEAVAAPLAAPDTDTQPAALVEPGAQDFILIHHRDRLYTADLAPIDPAAVPTDRRVILAVDPALSMDEAIRVRATLPSANLVISTLDRDWLKRLERTER